MKFGLVPINVGARSAEHVVTLAQGECVLFPSDQRPARGARGWHRIKLRHGVSTITRGERTTLGIIFHDAR